MQYAPLAFGFANLAMLGWLAAAAIPILIHLWNKRRYREESWAAIEFLLAALHKTSRRMWLEQWLLLLLRMALVAVIVLAVAQPFWQATGLAFAPGQRTLKVFVLDGSYSMGYRPTDKSRFERAKQRAAQIVEESTQGDAFMLVLLGSPPSVVVGTPAGDRRDFLDEIDALKLAHTSADLPATLVRLEELLAVVDDPGLSRREIVFLTDLGRNTWAPELKDEEAAGYRQRLDRLASQAVLSIVDVGQGGSENMAVTNLAVQEPLATTSREVTLEAQIRNFGSQARNRHLVELYVDGRRTKERYVDVPGGEQAALIFTHRFDAIGEHVVEVRLGSDLLDVDNHRWLSLPVKDRVRVLCVNGKPGAQPMTGAADYVVLALNPDAGEGSNSGQVQAEVIAESALVERDLAAYDCVFLCNVAQFTSAEARVLEKVLARGGGLVFFLGDQVLADRYNQELVDGNTHVLPARLGEVISEPQYQYRFDPLNYRHPLLSAFQGREQSGLLTTPVYKYFRLQPMPKSRVALAFYGGDPAIVEQTLGRGNSVLIATECSLSSVDPQTKDPWTTMPAWPSFLPIVHEILSLAIRGQQVEHNLAVGQPLGDSLDGMTARPTVEVTTPGGAHDEVRMSLEGQVSRWTYTDTWQSGIYHVVLGAPLARQENFSVNVDTSESDLARAAVEDLPRQFSARERTGLEQTDFANVSYRGGFHKQLLYLALGLLLAETAVAWWYGHSQ
jgi:hypothetical protein